MHKTFWLTVMALLVSTNVWAIKIREDKSVEQLLVGQPKWVALGVIRCKKDFRACRNSDPEKCVQTLDACLNSVVAAMDNVNSGNAYMAELDRAPRSLTTRKPAKVTRGKSD